MISWRSWSLWRNGPATSAPTRPRARRLRSFVAASAASRAAAVASAPLAFVAAGGVADASCKEGVVLAPSPPCSSISPRRRRRGAGAPPAPSAALVAVCSTGGDGHRRLAPLGRAARALPLVAAIEMAVGVERWHGAQPQHAQGAMPEPRAMARISRDAMRFAASSPARCKATRVPSEARRRRAAKRGMISTCLAFFVVRA